MSPGRCSLVTGQPECIDYCYTLQRYAGAFEVGFSHMSTSNCITFIVFSRHRFTANDRHSQSIAVSLPLERLLQSTSLAQARTLPFHVVCIMQRKWKHYKLVKRLISLQWWFQAIYHVFDANRSIDLHLVTCFIPPWFSSGHTEQHMLLTFTITFENSQILRLHGICSTYCF